MARVVVRRASQSDLAPLLSLFEELAGSKLTAGRPWAMLENVIVTASAQRMGVGRALLGHVIELARTTGCCKLQLISGKHRTEAHAFYRSMGLVAVAEGFKIYFDE